MITITPAQQQTDQSKEEKLAAARKLLQKYKNKDKDQPQNESNNQQQHLNHDTQFHDDFNGQRTTTTPLSVQTHVQQVDLQQYQPQFMVKSMTTSPINDIEREHNEYLKILSKNSPRSIDTMIDKVKINNSNHSPSNNSNTNESINESHLQNYYEQKYRKDIQTLKEQLQLHLQTIGILVAEKTELQSTLQQTQKKIDLKQHDIDDLAGRLKVSREKINELEKQLTHSSDSSNKTQQLTKDYEDHIESLKFELNSHLLTNNELKIRFNELNEKFTQKLNENERLTQKLNELSSQLEISQLRIAQLNSVSGEGLNDSYLKFDEIIRNLNEKLDKSDKSVNELKHELENNVKQKQIMQNEYQNYVDNLQKQIENLVDQINRMTDERESAFAKIDSLEKIVFDLKSENETLIELNNKMKIQSINELNNANLDERKQQLECEVQYFKQQIDILLKENNHLNGLIVDKENTISQMRKSQTEINGEKENYAKLLESMQGEKSALSRAIQQNNDLKSQLNELQEAYIKQTNLNADLLTKLQSEEYVNKQLNASLSSCSEEIEHLKHHHKHEHQQQQQIEHAISVIENLNAQNNSNNENINQDSSTRNEWGDDDNNQFNNQPANNEEVPKINPETNLLVQKLRIELDDARRKLEQVEQNSIKNEHKLKDIIDSLNSKILDLERERDVVSKQLVQLQNIQLQNNLNDSTTATNNSSSSQSESKIDESSIKLLEMKFTRIMQENADLKEKIQQQEHLIIQLQCETETIVDYISLYQIEREKLANKYKIKDENMRELNTKLEKNKELNSKLTEYLKQYFDFVIAGNNNNSNETTNPTEDNQEESLDNKRALLIQQISETITLINELGDQCSRNLLKNTDINNQIQEDSTDGFSTTSNRKSQYPPIRSIILCSSCTGDLFVV